MRTVTTAKWDFLEAEEEEWQEMTEATSPDAAPNGRAGAGRCPASALSC